MFACEHFEYYIYRRESVNVETDHQPLMSIVRKPLHKAPSRLLLWLQKFNLMVRYKKGSEMFLADTLNRAHLAEVNACEFALSLQAIYHTMDLAIPESQLQELKEVAEQDPVLQALSSTICQGSPASKSSLPEIVHPYFDVRDELTVQEELVFKGTHLVIPYALRRRMMEVVHDTHIGMDGCIRRAQECMYWPRMSTELREFISKCNVCLSYRPEQTKEPLEQQQFVARAWSKIGADLCEHDGRTLLVVSDYYSNFIEVEKITRMTSGSVIKVLKAMSARYGVPDSVVSDNGP